MFSDDYNDGSFPAFREIANPKTNIKDVCYELDGLLRCFKLLLVILSGPQVFLFFSVLTTPSTGKSIKYSTNSMFLPPTDNNNSIFFQCHGGHRRSLSVMALRF